MLCDKCHKNQNKKATKNCAFCIRLDFPEDILCCLTRGDSEANTLLECGAYRNKLSLVSSRQEKPTSIEHRETDSSGLSDKEKWFNAYAKQQLQLYPNEINFTLQFHVCLVSYSRKSIFQNPDNYVEKLTNIFNQIAVNLDNTHIEILWLNSDHIHLYVKTTPDYSLEEIVHKILKISEKEIISIYPEIKTEHNSIWESEYFAESIG